MTQPFKIQLNADALAALFPEGTQARIELQQAVTAEFVRKHFRSGALGTDVFKAIEGARTDCLASIERARTDVMTRVLAEKGLQKNWSSYTLQGEAKEAVSAAAKSIVEATAQKAASEAAAAAVDKLKAGLETAVDRRVNLIQDGQIRLAVKAHIDAVMASLNKPI